MVKSIHAPYTKKLDCNCAILTYRKSTSRKRGLYKVYERGIYKGGEYTIRNLFLVCMICGLEKTFNLEVKK